MAQQQPAPDGALFRDPLHQQLGTWMLGFTPYGGGDYGQVAAIAAAVGEGDDGAYYDAWLAAADRLDAEAERADAAGHHDSARELFLTASAHYGSAYHPLFGGPVDPRLLDAYRKQIAAFESGLARRDAPVTRREVTLDGATLPYYLITADGRGHERRPTIVLINGYDATVTDVYFASAVAALRRGYHCVVFDGPGQGGVLYEQGVPLRPDFEVVASAIIDAVVGDPVVDPDRIAVSGWSLGGYFAPRAATGDARIAACIADPGQMDLGASITSMLRRSGASDDVATGRTPLPAELEAGAMRFIEADRVMRWSIVQRGFWANGVTDLASFFDRMRTFTSRDRLASISCPVLLTHAENDPLAADVPAMAELIPKATVMPFAAAEGAGDHCSMYNRSLLNRRVLDWLDDVLEVDRAH